MDLVDVYEKSKEMPKKPTSIFESYPLPKFHFSEQDRCTTHCPGKTFYCTRPKDHLGVHEAHQGPIHACKIAPWID